MFMKNNASMSKYRSTQEDIGKDWLVFSRLHGNSEQFEHKLINSRTPSPIFDG